MSSTKRKKPSVAFGQAEDHVPSFDKNDKFIQPGQKLYNPFDRVMLRDVHVNSEGHLFLSQEDNCILDFPVREEWEVVTVH